MGVLAAVLGWLDGLAVDADESTNRTLTFAAIRVQEAIDLIADLEKRDL